MPKLRGGVLVKSDPFIDCRECGATIHMDEVER